MGVRATLAVLLLFIATVEAADGGVEFWELDFTMTCPGEGNWFKKKGESLLQGNETYKLQYDGKTKGSYHCEYNYTNDASVGTYYFYVKGKVCKNCFELDASLFGGVIAVDVLVTAILMMVIFKYTKKKSSAGLSHASKAPARSGGRAQAAQSPTYEPLSPHTRAQDPYSVVNRMG
ncbi:T-cell surface glycoprotein CD3 epsilon chain-like [Sebastes fasciatus]|uniref:T-cell surface glycoprotein CD3 epsilon chain-like n=1 Tax=Sebastes fasciatus TaxID=394691 RepID=UPI003D9F9C9B